MSIEAKFDSLKEMNKATEKYIAFIENLAPSSSSLFVGVEAKLADEYLNLAAKIHAVEPIDICYLNADSKTGKQEHIYIEAAKKWLHDLSISPKGKLKIGVILRADRLNEQSANALLKTLEEPPKSVIILLFSSSDNLLTTIKSRCRILFLHKNNQAETVNFDETILSKPFYEQVKEIEKIVKDNETSEFLIDLEKAMERKLRNDPQRKYSLFLKNIFETGKRIRQNANARLQLENLLLSYKGKK